MKIRIFALAKELGMDSKLLIKHCNDIGVPVKSSALASISPEERDIVVDSLKSKQGTSTPTAEAAPMAPTRDQTREITAKVREIKAMTPRVNPTLARHQQKSTDAPLQADVSEEATPPAVEAKAVEPPAVEPSEKPKAAAAEPAAPVVAPETPAEPVAEKPVADKPVAAEPVAAKSKKTKSDTVESDRAEPDAAEPVAATGSSTKEPEVVTEGATAKSTEPPTKKKIPKEAVEKDLTASTATLSRDDKSVEPIEKPQRIVPISRDDYVPAGGASASGIREMKPRGTTPEGSPRGSKRQKSRNKPALPNLAIPTYKVPKVKKAKVEEEKAQKPELRLTADVLEQQSPLASHLRKHAEQKLKKGDEEQPTEGASRRSGRGGTGASLEESRTQRREKRKQSKRHPEEEPSRSRTRGMRRRRPKGGAPVVLKTSAQIEFPITVRGFCEAVGRPAKDVLRILFNQGQMATINENLDEETALELGLDLGVDLEVKRQRDIEIELMDQMDTEEEGANLQTRPPIITILGHVDHGKTSLLDRIRSADVAAGEAGGITQHIASYQVEHNGQKLTFVDTPGHAAFGEMRARGANVTDIIVLVVAADDGVMPQTVECISHAKAADVPVVVALNKIDLPDVNIEKILADLAQNNIVASEWGGDIEIVRTSASSGEGIDDLLETLLVTAELQEYKTDPDQPAMGICLEAFRDEGRGAVAWLIVRKGTLRIGDMILCGSAFGRIRAMYNDRDEEVTEAGPSTPIRVAGLDIVPGAGDHFFVMTDQEEAREVAEKRRHRGRTKVLAGRGLPRTLDDILNAARAGAVQDLPLILKADSPGSIEALRGEIGKLEHPEVRVKILHEGVGGVNESDVYLASASGAIIIAFHVIAEDRASSLAEREGVEVRRYNIIYEVTDHIKRTLEGLLLPERVEVATGRALVLQTFSTSRFGTIAGCRILSGTIERSNRVHVIRDQTVLNAYAIASLKREKDDAKEVREGMECGIRLDGFNDVKEGDLLEAFRIDSIKRTLD